MRILIPSENVDKLSNHNVVCKETTRKKTKLYFGSAIWQDNVTTQKAKGRVVGNVY